MREDAANVRAGRPDAAGAERWRPYGEVPRVSGLDTVRVVEKAVREDITDGLAYVRETYGPTARLDLPGSVVRGILVARPDPVEHVLETNQSNYRKPDEYLDTLRHQGESLTTTRGAEWRDQHRLLAPMFQPDRVAQFSDLVVDRTEAALQRWRSIGERGGTIDLQEEMGRITLQVLGRALFSADMDEHAEEVLDAIRAIRGWMGRVISPIPYPLSYLDRRFEQPVETFQGLAEQLIEKRRGQENEYGDLLSMMMRAEADGGGMSDRRIVDNVISFLIGGSETTALALTWTLYLLARHPDVHRRLHETVVDSAVADGTHTPDALEEIGYVKQAIQEGMRVYPPVPMIPRQAIDDDVVGGYAVPAGTRVIVSPFLTHREPTIWDEPLAFRPERFAPGRGDDRPRYSFFPFGGGARMCIGRTFALLEAQLVLALIAADCRLELAAPSADERVGVSSVSTMAPASEIRMSVGEWE